MMSQVRRPAMSAPPIRQATATPATFPVSLLGTVTTFVTAGTAEPEVVVVPLEDPVVLLIDAEVLPGAAEVVPEEVEVLLGVVEVVVEDVVTSAVVIVIVEAGTGAPIGLPPKEETGLLDIVTMGG